MGEIVDFRKRIAKMADCSVEESEFLMNEGLDLLVSYRSISDKAIRQAFLDLIKMIAADNGAPKRDVI